MGREGILFVGDEGAILAGFHGQDPQLFAKGKKEPLWKDGAAAAGGTAAEPRQASQPVDRGRHEAASRRREVS